MGKAKKPNKGTLKKNVTKHTAPCAKSKDYKKRLAKLKNIAFICERGIHVSDLNGTTIPGIVKNRKWEEFVKTPGVANATLVKDFYASMIPSRFFSTGEVLVRGVVVVITADLINGFFKTEGYDNLPLGYEQYKVSRKDLAKLLRDSDDGLWTRDHDLKQSELPKDLALLNVFHSYSLRPTHHRTTISVARAELLACHLSNGKIDVGKVVRAEIYAAGVIDLEKTQEKGKKSIPFPCLITKFCRNAGVPQDVDDESVTDKRGDINLRSWKDTSSKTKGRKRLRTGSFRRSPDNPDQEPASDGGENSDDEDEDWENNPDDPKLLSEVLARIEDKITAIAQRMDKLDEERARKKKSRADLEDELDELRIDTAEIRTHLEMQVYQRKEGPKPISRTTKGISISDEVAAHTRAAEGILPGFSAADFFPDSMTAEDIEKRRKNKGIMD